MMETKYFKCIFLSDVVLNADTATEGNRDVLDFIPGSNFLGIAAKSYSEFLKEGLAFDIFHSGKVRFGDAHLSQGDLRSLKKPAAWFMEKKDKNDACKKKIYVHHKIPPEKVKYFHNNGVQLKQVRTGYFVHNQDLLELSAETSFAIKSAYDSSRRKSEDEQLYGYNSIRKGAEWIFSVQSDETILLEKVSSMLPGEHNIGRSRSAQYGRVKIEKLDYFKDYSDFDDSSGEQLVIYFENRAAFFDENGQPTYQPSVKDLMLPDGAKILWEKSQILTFVYSPWNGARKTRDADRVCIGKGSVIVVGNIGADFNISEYRKKIACGIGFYRSEGFGKVLVNPSFLTKTDKDGVLELEFSDNNKTERSNGQGLIRARSDFEKWLDAKFAEKVLEFEILKTVMQKLSEKKSEFSPITASQWGAIRAIAERSESYSALISDLFREPQTTTNRQGDTRVQEEGGFLRHGKKMKDWNDKNRWQKFKEIVGSVHDELKDDSATIKFVILFCSEMAKNAKKQR